MTVDSYLDDIEPEIERLKTLLKNRAKDEFLRSTDRIGIADGVANSINKSSDEYYSASHENAAEQKSTYKKIIGENHGDDDAVRYISSQIKFLSQNKIPIFLEFLEYEKWEPILSEYFDSDDPEYNAFLEETMERMLVSEPDPRTMQNSIFYKKNQSVKRNRTDNKDLFKLIKLAKKNKVRIYPAETSISALMTADKQFGTKDNRCKIANYVTMQLINKLSPDKFFCLYGNAHLLKGEGEGEEPPLQEMMDAQHQFFCNKGPLSEELTKRGAKKEDITYTKKRRVNLTKLLTFSFNPFKALYNKITSKDSTSYDEELYNESLSGLESLDDDDFDLLPSPKHVEAIDALVLCLHKENAPDRQKLVECVRNCLSVDLDEGTIKSIVQQEYNGQNIDQYFNELCKEAELEEQKGQEENINRELEANNFAYEKGGDKLLSLRYEAMKFRDSGFEIAGGIRKNYMVSLEEVLKSEDINEEDARRVVAEAFGEGEGSRVSSSFRVAKLLIEAENSLEREI